MSLVIAIPLLMIAVVAFEIGRVIGANQQLDKVRRHLDKASAYQMAVDDLDRWCGHTSRHAKVIARHLKARGEFEDLNAGTPVGDEACDISGLREQLRRIDDQQANGEA